MKLETFASKSNSEKMSSKVAIHHLACCIQREAQQLNTMRDVNGEGEHHLNQILLSDVTHKEKPVGFFLSLLGHSAGSRVGGGRGGRTTVGYTV